MKDTPKTDEEKALLDRAYKRFQKSADAWHKIRQDFSDNIKFYDGQQWDDRIKSDREIQNRPCIVVNRCPQFVRQITNDQRQNRPSIKVRPVDDNADVETAEIFSGIIKHIEANSCADIAYDTAFFYQVAGNMGFFRLVTDYIPQGFEQEIYIRPIENPLCVYPDADGKSSDGSDWRYCFIIDELDKEDFKRQYGDYLPNGWTGDGLEEQGWVTDDRVRVAEYFEVTEVKKLLVKLEDGRIMYGEDYEALEVKPAIVDQRDAMVPKVTWYLIGGDCILDTKPWAGMYIPVVPVFGDMCLVNGELRIYSAISFAKDAMRMLNYYRSTEAEVYALQPKTPFIIAEGQVEGYEELWMTANTVNHAFLPYKPDSVGGTQVPPPNRSLPMGLPQGALQLSQIAEQDIMNTTGIHEAGLGMRSNETSGAAIMARQREGDNSTFHFIDNMARSIRRTGKILVDLIPQIYDTPGRVVRVLGEDGSEKTLPINQPVTIEGEEIEEIGRIYDLSAGVYDVVCEAGPSFNTKRAEGAAFLERVAGSNPNLMQMIGDLVFKMQDLPYADEIAERLQKTLPPELRPQKEGEEGQALPPEVQQQMQAAQQQIEQMGQAMQEMQQQLADKQAEQQAAMAKLQIEQEKVAIDRFNAETNRIKVEGDLALKANDDLTESEKEQFKADLALRLKELEQDHALEMELLRKQLTPPPTPEKPAGITVQRDASGNVLTVNGRNVQRDAAGNIIGVE